ncbi:hypothetical protein [Nostoc sp. NMS8]|uniref:hypothetical protein n=1 Tax=Nostoc sp. NMS8 TaxID=2815392 RepID=UPI0025D86A69|nr:hypothetical protein [Nostoc sp. NMS8]MBN3959233.1 hypothetical protein [Nostoc sp. NMS8]
MKADYLEESLLRQLEERLLQPDVRKSAKDIMDLLADEFIEPEAQGVFSINSKLSRACRMNP